MALDVRATETELAERARAGDTEAFGLLYDAWFDRVHDLARRIVRDPGAAADVAHDAFLAAFRGLDRLRDADAFGGWLLRITRNAAFDRAQRDRRSTPVDGEAMTMIEDSLVSDRGSSPADAPSGFGVEERLGALGDPARVVEDHELAELVWESADALGPRDAEVLHLSLRHGLPPAEIAETIGVTRNHANQLVHRVKQRLGGAIRARVLWRGGKPACDNLAAELRDAGVDRFGADAVTIATDHAERCDVCSERRALKLAPTALFAATPVAAAPAVLKARVAKRLEHDGVRMEGSQHAPLHRRAGRVRRLAQAGAAVAAVAVVAGTAAVVLAGGGASGAGGEGGAADAPTTTVTPSTTSATTTTTTTLPPEPQPILPADDPALAPGGAPAPEPAGGAVPGGAALEEPPPPPPPPPPVTADLALSPTTMPDVYPMFSAPVLTWSTGGGGAVQVSGPGMSSSAPSGSAPLCPGSSGSMCTAAPGSYTYTLVVWDGNGQIAAERSVTLTIV